MMKLIYTDHLKLRLRIRKIPENYPKDIYESPEQSFYDNSEGKFIRIKKLYYNKKERNMMIVFNKSGSEIEIITIHPITDEKIINRVMSNRWTRK